VHPVDATMVVVFMVLTFGVGIFFYRWIGTPDDYYVAGRELTPFILAGALTATNVSLYAFVNEAGSAYANGLSIIWHSWTGNMALAFAGLFVVPLMRRLRVRTVPEFLELRYSKSVRTLVAILWIVRCTYITGILMYTVALAAQIITGSGSFTFWLITLTLITGAYTLLGGQWSVTLMDVLQLLLMLAAALIMFPIVMSLVGWWPGMTASLPPGFLDLIVAKGDFNWLFVLSIWVLGIQWASTDQAMLQRAFSARDAKTVAKGLVLAGVITTPFALLWYVPGVASSILVPGLDKVDAAIPTIIARYIPHGVLGLIACGFLASQMSTYSGFLNSLATLFTNDIYNSLFKRQATNRQILVTVRVFTGVLVVSTIGFAYLIPRLGGGVKALLTMIGITDMPLFVVAIVYGLLWRRSTPSGAIVGYLSGAAAGLLSQFVWHSSFNQSTFISAGTALVVCPLVSWLTRPVGEEKLELFWRARGKSEAAGGSFNIIPVSDAGRLSLGLAGLGLLVFLGGTVSGAFQFGGASALAVSGMIVYFGGCLLRLRYD